MIIFELRCAHGHRFEGWFASGAEFDRQAAAELVRCPVCDDATVARVPSAKVRARGGATRAVVPKKATETDDAIAGLPPALVKKLRDAVRKAENVGQRFPEEARKIHYDEAPARAIRGQASSEEAEALQEEGIDFTSLPPFLTRETH
ncbi:MAG: DUF1178 family protein [Betaproteobacteria bacterium]